MAANLITAPTFPQLEARLLADLCESSQQDPLAPKWVIVPSATLANHLRVRLARIPEHAFAGVRVLNLPRFTQRLCVALLGAGAPPWEPALDLLLMEMVEGLNKDSPLEELKTIRGGAILLRQTFAGLAEGGFGFDERDRVRDLAAENSLPPRERETLLLYARWLELLRERNLKWEPLAVGALAGEIDDATDEQLHAALGCEQGQNPRLYLHGFYEWTDVNLQWMAALARKAETIIYYPWRAEAKEGHAAFAFAKPVLEDLMLRLDITEAEPDGAKIGEAGRFFLKTFPEGPIKDRPAFLTHQRASGARAEAISGAVRIREWLDAPDRPLLPEDILVVAPQAEGYAEAVQEVFAAFAVPLRVADVAAGPTPEQEPLRILARIWEEQAPAEWVLALLRLTPKIPVADEVWLEAFEGKVRELGIWGGSAWRAGLQVGQWSEAERKLIKTITGFVAEDGKLPPARLTAANALAVMQSIGDQWLTDSTSLQPLLTALEAVAKVKPEFSIERTELTRLLAESGGAKSLRDPLTRGVLFVPLMRARGLTPRAVVILGLAAGQFPFRVEDDPLLSEPTSLRLALLAREAKQIGHRLPQKSRLTEELSLLFFLVNTAAERVHWVVPETDSLGKAVAPTPWVQRYLRRWASETGENAPIAFRRVARSPFEQAVYLGQRDVQGGSMLPPSFALYVEPELVEKLVGAAAMQELAAGAAKRGIDPAWSGCVNARYTPDKISVTALGLLAKCPFRFYAEKVAGWKPLEALSISHDVNALVRGSMLHDLLAHVVRPHLKKGTIGGIAAAALAGDGQQLRKGVDEVLAMKPELNAAVAILPPSFREAAIGQVLDLATRYLDWARDQTAVPQDVEQEFQLPFPGLEGVKISGKVDRIDAKGAQTKLWDFKSGGSPKTYRKEVTLGWQIQARLYPWLSGHPDADFSYVFLKRKVATGNAEGVLPAEEFLRALAPILEKGLYIPISTQFMEELGIENMSPCYYCDSLSACRRFEPGSARRHAKLFKENAPHRLQSILQVVAPKKGTTQSEAPPLAESKPARGKKTS